MAKQQGTDFDTVKTSNRKERQSIEDNINLFRFPEGKWVTLRLVGGLFSYATYWCKVDNKDPKSTKRFSVVSPSWDPTTQEFDSTIYDPWRDLNDSQPYDKDDKDFRNKQLVQIQKRFYLNAISRAAQKNAPSRLPKPTAGEREAGFKDKDSDTWTPYVVVGMSPGLVQKIKELSDLNTVESKKTGATKPYPVSNDKYGRDVRVKYDSSKPPANMYEVQLGERSALTEEELAYLQWDLSELVTPASETENRRDFEGWAQRMGIKTNKKRKHEVEEFDDEELDDDVESDEDDEEPKKKGKVGAKKALVKKGKKVVDEDEDEEDEDSDDFDDEDEDDDDDDEAPKSKKKAPAKKPVAKGKKVVDEDEDDESDSDFDEDDEEEEPKKKGKVAAKKAPAKKGKKVIDDEDDEEDDLDDDDSDEDDEDDEPPAKSKKPVAKGKKKIIDEDDEDDFDDDEDEEDEDDEPVKKKGKVVAKKATAKKSKKVVDEDEAEDDDFGDDDSDEDDEDEDEAPKKKVVKKKGR